MGPLKLVELDCMEDVKYKTALTNFRGDQLVVTAHNPKQGEVVEKDSRDCWSVQLWAQIDQAVPQTARAVHLPAQL